MKEATLPNCLESIDRFAFAATGLESVELPASLRKITHGAFYKCNCLKAVKFGEGLEVLGTDEYSNNGKMWCGVFEESSVEHVKLPSTLKRIEYSAFENCKNLTKIQLPENLRYIGRRCFWRSGLKNVEFPASLRTVAQTAFAKCESLRTVKFNEGLEVLGTDEYFDNCKL